MSTIDFQKGFVAGMATRGLIKNNQTPEENFSDKWTRPSDWITKPEFNLNYDEVFLLLAVYPKGINNYSFLASHTEEVTSTFKCEINGIDYPLINNAQFNFSIDYNDIPVENYSYQRDYKTIWVKIITDRGKLKKLDLGTLNTNIYPPDLEKTYIGDTQIVEYLGSCKNTLYLILKRDYIGSNYDSNGRLKAIPYKLESFEHYGSLYNYWTEYSIWIQEYDINIVDGIGFNFMELRFLSNINDIEFIEYENEDSEYRGNYNYMFAGCENLKEIALTKIKNAISLVDTFSYCTNLEKVVIKAPNVTNIDRTFYQCTSLQKANLIFGEKKIISASETFFYCFKLLNLPFIDLRATLNLLSFANLCLSIRTIPEYELLAIDDLSYAFSSCFNLISCPNLHISEDKINNIVEIGIKNLFAWNANFVVPSWYPWEVPL